MLRKAIIRIIKCLKLKIQKEVDVFYKNEDTSSLLSIASIRINFL